MEIQGLTAAQNTYRQHGVSCRTDLSSPGTTNEHCRTISTGGRSKDELREPESDSNKRPRTSPFRILSEHGSGSGGSLHSFKQNAGRSKTQETQAFGANIGLYNVVSSHGNGVNKQLLQQDCRETGLKNETEESGLHFAFPVYLVDECQSQQSQQQQGTKRQPHKDGATLHNALVRETTPGVKTTAISPKTSSKETEGYYVVFNVVEGEDSPNNLGSNKETGRALCPSKDEKGKDAGIHRTRQDMSMEINSSSEMLHPDEKLPMSVAERNFREGLCFEPGEGANSVVMVKEPNRSEQGPRKQSSDIMPVSDISATSTEQLPDELPQSEQQQQNHGAYITDMSGIDNGSNSLSDFSAIAANSLSCSGPSHSETFSGTITINNQNIIVTIENGVLTLATPQEGHAHKEGMVNLKEQLSVKESQDIVLINCSSATTKTIGNASCTEANSVQYEEPRGCLSVSDLGLTLNSDCSFSDPSSALDSCTSGKEQEDGTLCSLDEGDGAQAGYMLCDGVEPQPAKRDESAGMIFRKGGLVTYHCPQQGCAETFDTKHKLKVHLLSHTEDQRPFRCSVEGCGWSFTTSYKLKRHLQSHDKVRPFACPWESCGRRFTTVYNLKAHVKMHDQESAFVCEICSERFRTSTRLGNHQRTHFEPERPHKCEYPGCEKTFITFSALFSHNRTHFRETDQFNCTYPGCDKRYDKACRLKIHLRSHTGERPFVCDFEGCGWSFTSMSKLLRHRRKHDDDRRFTCQEEGCGKSFTRAEHLKGHRITHLGTKPFECPVEGCSAKFSARSSLYIHSKKHQQDSGSQRTRCPVASCSKHFSSRGSLRTHMLKHHNLSPDLLSQLEISTSLTPSSELTCVGQNNGVVGASASGGELGNLDLSSLFSNVPGGSGAAVSGAPSNLSLDMSLVSSGILTIDATSVGATLGGPTGALAQAVDPLILAAAPDMGSPGLDSALVSSTSGVLPQTTLSLEDVQTVNPEALGSLAAVAMRGSVAPDQLHPLGSPADAPTALLPSSSLAGSHVPELLSPGPKEDRSGGAARNVPDVLAHPDGGKVVTQFVFPGHTEGFSAQKDAELGTISACPFLESRGSARTDYRAIQLAKRKKRHKGPGSTPGCPSLGQRKNKGGKAAGVTVPTPSAAGHFGAGVASSNGGLTVRDPATGAQFVQIQLLQDDPAGDGDLAFQLSSQTSSSHSQLTVDLPVNILQEPPATPEDDAGSDTSQFTGSTINLQDLE